ncbi:hypothetical protein L208DRAFT_1107616, partial [Tricholoma matsutake]
PTFHASVLKCHHANDPELFPSWEFACPGPIVTTVGIEEYTIEKIIDKRFQYLVHWNGFGTEEDCWLPRRELEECEALDRWLS